MSVKRLLVTNIAVALVLAMVIIVVSYSWLYELKQTLVDESSTNFTERVEPCEDFYTFACRDWMDAHQQPGMDIVKTSVFTERQDAVRQNIQEIISAKAQPTDPDALKKAKRFYSNCIDRQTLNSRGSAPILNLVRRLGGWPILETDHKVNRSITESIVLLKGVANWNEKIGFYHDRGLFYVQGSTMPDSGVLTIYPPSIIMEHLFLKAFSTKDPYVSYRDYIHAVIQELSPSTGNQSLYTNIDRMIRFEARLVYALREETFESSHSQLFVLKDFENFVSDGRNASRRAHRKIDWLRVLSQIHPSVTVKESTEILVVFPQYFQELVSILLKTNLRLETIRNFMIWTVVSNVVSESTDQMREIQFNHQMLQNLSREEACSQLVVDDASGPYYPWIYAVGWEYVQRFLTNQDVLLVSKLVRSIREAFMENIRSSPWLDSSTKSSLTKNLEAIRTAVGYPSWILNSTLLNSYYNGLNFPGSSHFENYLFLMEFQADVAFGDTPSSPVSSDGTYRLTDPPFLSVSPRYSSTSSALTIPAGVIALPYFDSQCGLSGSNFGAMGSVIGHELAHAVYSELFPEDGDTSSELQAQSPLWTENATTTMTDRLGCISSNYKMLAEAENLILTGSTAEEDLADTEGLLLAYLAFKKHRGLHKLDADQAFYMSFAKIWCANYSPQLDKEWLAPHNRNSIRVSGSVMNSPDFSQAFSCTSDSRRSSLPKKCSLLN